MTTFLTRVRSRQTILAVAAVVALAAAGIAIAGPGTGSSTIVSATFNATSLGNSHSQTCTAANGDAITVTDVTFTGTAASSDSRLAGPATLHITSVYDGTTNAGSLTGDVRIDSGATPPPPGHFHAQLTAVNVNGSVQGFLTGDAGAGAHFTGGFSASFSTTGGFTSGSIGAGNPTNAAIITTGGCAHPNPPHPGKGHKGHHH